MAADESGDLEPSALLNAQSEIVDVIAAGADLRETLRRVALIIEALTPPAICSILLLDPDGVHVRHGASPSLPDGYVAAIDGLPIGPCAGSCGTAAYERRLVIVEDISTDPLWDDYRHLALPIGLLACWSQPIIDEAGTVLGTFALYYRERRAPGPADLDLVDRMTRLVRVALAQDRRQQALVDTEQKLRDYISLSSDWLWERYDEGHQYYAESSVFRVDPGMLRLNSALEALVLGAEAQILETVGRDVAARRPFRNARTSYTMPDGQVHFLNVNAFPMFDRNGTFLGYRGVSHDITSQVATENESHRLKLEAQDANRAKTEFLANISHELRTPLNAILGFSEIMQGQLLGPLSERYRQYAADIHASGQHLHALVTDILNLSQIEMGRMELEEEEISVTGLVASCVDMLGMRAAEGGVRLIAEHAPAALLIRGDRLRLMQALLNLVSNAVKFTPELGSVTVSSGAVPDGLALVVRDTGIGMRPEDIPLALEPFRQIDGSSSRNQGGVGLGLALAKSLVELHGGRLELMSTPGDGTMATIHLPANRIVAAAEG